MLTIVSQMENQMDSGPGLPDGKFKKINLGKFWSVLPWKMLEYFMAISPISLLFGIF
jgi:hypothetical protein